MKRYWLFAGIRRGFEKGGMNEFIGGFDDPLSAIDKGREEKPISPEFLIRGTFNWYQVVDIVTNEILFQESNLEEERGKRGKEARTLAFEAWEKECEGK